MTKSKKVQPDDTHTPGDGMSRRGDATDTALDGGVDFDASLPETTEDSLIDPTKHDKHVVGGSDPGDVETEEEELQD